MINKHCTVHTHWAHLIYIQLSSNKSQRHNSAYIPTKIIEHLSNNSIQWLCSGRGRRHSQQQTNQSEFIFSHRTLSRKVVKKSVRHLKYLLEQPLSVIRRTFFFLLEHVWLTTFLRISNSQYNSFSPTAVTESLKRKKFQSNKCVEKTINTYRLHHISHSTASTHFHIIFCRCSVFPVIFSRVAYLKWNESIMGLQCANTNKVRLYRYNF